jgi:hypothetical protein
VPRRRSPQGRILWLSVGRRVDFQNVGRYLDNSEFIGLVKKAWIGTTPAQSELLTELIREILASGRTVTLAIKTEQPRQEHPNERDERN